MLHLMQYPYSLRDSSISPLHIAQVRLVAYTNDRSAGDLLRYHLLQEKLRSLATEPTADRQGETLIVDGHLPIIQGPAATARIRDAGGVDPSTTWMVRTVKALESGHQVVLHDIDPNGPVPPWATELVTDIVRAATYITTSTAIAVANLARFIDDDSLTRIPHPLSDTKAPPAESLSEREMHQPDEPYFLIEIESGSPHAVQQLLAKTTGRPVVGFRASGGQLFAQLIETADDTSWRSVSPPTLIDLLAGASAVVSADQNLTSLGSALATEVVSDPKLITDRRISGITTEQSGSAGHPTARHLGQTENGGRLESHWAQLGRVISGRVEQIVSGTSLTEGLLRSQAALAEEARSERLAVADLRDRRAGAEQRIESLSEDLASAKKQIASANKRLEKGREANQVAQDAHRDYRKTIRKNEAKIERLDSNLQTQREAARAQDAAMAILRTELAAKEAELKRLELETTRSSAEIVQVRAELAANENQTRELLSQYDELKLGLGRSDEKYRRLRSRRSVRLALFLADQTRRLSFHRSDRGD